MIELFKTMILDFQQTPLKVGVPRRVPIEQVPGKATICMGVRRSGKSTYLLQVIQHLLDDGVSQQNILSLNFFDDRLHNLKQDGLNLIIEAYYALYPEKKNAEKIYCFFDEIQEIPGWELFINRLMRTEECEIYITGSSAKLLSKEIATQMRGRSLSWEIFPFSFQEYLDYKKIHIEKNINTKQRLLVQQAFEQYWIEGGFPEVFDLNKNMRIKIHQEYFHAI
jgi:uncharacterized protein